MSQGLVKKIIVIDQNLCLNCQTCTLLDPETFHQDPKTQKVEIKKQPESFEKIKEDTKIAIESCPQKAIKINNS